MHSGQQLCTKWRFPSCQTCRRCWCRLLSRKRSFEGAFASPETRSAAVRHHACPYSSLAFYSFAMGRWYPARGFLLADNFFLREHCGPRTRLYPFTAIRKTGSLSIFRTALPYEKAMSSLPNSSSSLIQATFDKTNIRWRAWYRGGEICDELAQCHSALL